MLYNFYKIQDQILRESKRNKISVTKGNFGSFLKSLSLENLIEKNIVDEVYFHPEHHPSLVSKETIDKISSYVNEQYGVNLNLADFVESLDRDNDPNSVNKKIKGTEDYKRLFKLFIENTPYGKEFLSEKEKKAENGRVKKIENERLHGKIRQERVRKENEKHHIAIDFAGKKIVCIDLEFMIKKNKNHGQLHLKQEQRSYDVTEVGISYAHDDQRMNKHFLIKEHYQKKANQTLQQKFEFGETIVISQNKSVEFLDRMLKEVDIVVFHESREDIKALKMMGLNLKDYPNITILDTQNIYKKMFNVFGKDEGLPLNKLLDIFDVDYKKNILHNGGNDAEYTLQLLFKIKQQNDEKTALLRGDKNSVDTAIKLLQKEAEKEGISLTDFVKRYEQTPNNKKVNGLKI